MAQIDDVRDRSPRLTQIPPSPWRIIDALGLGNGQELDAITDSRHAFTSVHLGTRDLKASALLDLIRSDCVLSPPRTGHIGNWGNIALGRSGAMDFNKAICTNGYGYPLLYCFTQTETEEPRQGDWGYLPGSIIERDVRTPLALHAWDGAAFARVSHARPRFTPFVQADTVGGLRSLIEVHKERLRRLHRFGFRLEQAVIARNEHLVRPMLRILLEAAAKRDTPRRALQDLISHTVALDGTLMRAEVHVVGRGFRLGGQVYASADELVTHALIPFQAVEQPRSFLAQIGDLPPQLPIVSHLLMAVFSAVLSTHYPDMVAGCTTATAPFNPHLHWGGRDMAGYPPRNSGYLFENAKIRGMKRIATMLVANFRDINPISFILLPATVFMLWPSSAHRGDSEIIAELFRQVRPLAGTPDATGTRAMQKAIDIVTRGWLDAHMAGLSDYFLDRFGPRRGGLVGSGPSERSEPYEPEGFRDLTLRQLSMIVGALYKILADGSARK